MKIKAFVENVSEAYSSTLTERALQITQRFAFVISLKAFWEPEAFEFV
ncbi:MAG: hypothetical protein ACM3UZ_15745 [Acidobacteriota bacterium]